MSQIKLKHSGGNSVIIATPDSNPASDRTLKLPGDADGTILTSNTAVGKIIQVVQTVKTDTFSTSSQSFTDITGLSASITPSSASNKILVSYTLSFASSGFPMLKLLRGSTDIFVGDAASNRVRCLFGGYTGGLHPGLTFPVSGNFLDSPNTTSATTYKFQTGVINTTGYNIYLNRSVSDTDHNYHARTASSIVLKEVAA